MKFFEESIRNFSFFYPKHVLKGRHAEQHELLYDYIFSGNQTRIFNLQLAQFRNVYERKLVNLWLEITFRVLRNIIHWKRGKWSKFDYFTPNKQYILLLSYLTKTLHVVIAVGNWFDRFTLFTLTGSD